MNGEPINPGYKHTEVGVIPEDWDTTSLSGIVASNGLVRGPFGGALKKEVFVESGFKVYEQKNVIYRSTDIGSYFVDANKYLELRRFQVKPGDFIVSCSGTIGRIFRIPAGAHPGIINQALLKITLDPGVVNPEFFYHYFDWDNFQEKIIDNTQGGAMQNLVGMEIFRAVPIPLPPLAEQHSIAKSLSDVDALLDALDRLIAKKRAIKQGAMQGLLTGRVRLPGFDGEWRTTRIGDLLNYERPEKYIVHNTEYVAVGTPVLTANKSFVLGYTDEEFGIYADLPVIVFDDFTTDSKYADFPFKVKSSAIKLLKPKDGRTNLKYMFERMKLINFSLGDHKRYYISEYQNIEIPVPSPKEQHALAEVLSDMDAEIDILEKRRAKLRDIKQGMMQELLSGRIRLEQLEESVQEAHV